MKHIFESVASPETLFIAWDEFMRGKRNKEDVLSFERDLEENIFALSQELRGGTYRHGIYKSFFITDPKQRHIHKALVRDRIVHHALFKVLNPIFEPSFIFDSYSCRTGKGTHKAVNRLRIMLRRASRNNMKTCWVLKCDIKKFFFSVDHPILLSLIRKKTSDEKLFSLVQNIVESFPDGLPIGNLTSQLFANIYMNELDQFIKHQLHVRHYIRYTDDFILIDLDKDILVSYLEKITAFLRKKLNLELHPKKILFRKYTQGIDFLGYVEFPKYRLLRTKTKKRMIRNAMRGLSEQSLASYLGVLEHANAKTLSKELKNIYWFSKTETPRLCTTESNITPSYILNYGWMDGWMDGWMEMEHFLHHSTKIEPCIHHRVQNIKRYKKKRKNQFLHFQARTTRR